MFPVHMRDQIVSILDQMNLTASTLEEKGLRGKTQAPLVGLVAEGIDGPESCPKNIAGMEPLQIRERMRQNRNTYLFDSTCRIWMPTSPPISV